ncbi:MAG: isoprenylcysteine carboxylmethyltransferase family protein [Ruminococcus sp.]|nr:isoprenylcysteine carboxylmethyltransferase family protein [Ruminococcus sp.]
MKNRKDHLPIYGPGPVFGVVVIALTVAAMFCGNLPPLRFGYITILRIPLIAVGIILILFAIFLWVYAVIITKIDDGIRHNHLVTTGAYALVRNPIYSAILILCTGVLMIGGNVLFLILPFLYRAFLTILLKQTEEKWLRELYGEAYVEYCRMVNRCIPWFPKR